MSAQPPFINLGPPTLAGFQAFLIDAGFNVTVLPPTSTSILIALQMAVETVNLQIAQISQNSYTLAVYNFATDRLCYFAPDQPNQTFFGGGPQGVPPGLRQQFNLNAFGPGVIRSASDEATSQTFEVPPGLQDLMILDLENLRTPWGRAYLAIAQQVGPGLWGLS